MANNIFPVSIEKFAAYLDGNLSADEMQEMSALIENNDSMHLLAGANSIVDESLTAYSDNDMQLPIEIQEDFEIPNLDNPLELESYGMESMLDYIDSVVDLDLGLQPGLNEFAIDDGIHSSLDDSMIGLDDF